VAPLAEKLVRLELALAEAAVPERYRVVEWVLVPLGPVSVEATERVAAERKILGPVIGPVVELAQEIPATAIAPAVGQAPTARAREPVRCRRAGAVAQMALVIALSHPAPGSVRVATLLGVVALTQAPHDQQVTAEAPAWEAADSAMAVAEEAHAREEADEVAVADVGDDETIEEER
jgi:hypothetical protein